MSRDARVKPEHDGEQPASRLLDLQIPPPDIEERTLFRAGGPPATHSPAHAASRLPGRRAPAAGLACREEGRTISSASAAQHQHDVAPVHLVADDMDEARAQQLDRGSTILTSTISAVKGPCGTSSGANGRKSEAFAEVDTRRFRDIALEQRVEFRAGLGLIPVLEGAQRLLRAVPGAPLLSPISACIAAKTGISRSSTSSCRGPISPAERIRHHGAARDSLLRLLGIGNRLGSGAHEVGGRRKGVGALAGGSSIRSAASRR